MNPTLSYDDLVGRLRELYALPPNERKSPAIKQELFTMLLYQPTAEQELLLADIAKTQSIEYEQAVQEFAAFKEEIEVKQKNMPYKPLPNPKRPVDPNIGIEELATPLTTCLADIQGKPVDWLWENFIPIGGGTLLSGDPGSAKTWFALDIAARLSRGSCWIDGSIISKPGNTIYLSIEDDASYTLRPRFDSLGGDPARIAVYNSEQPLHLDLSKQGGLERLENEVNKIGDVKLVVIDPILDFSGKVDPNKAEQVRALLTPLISIATRCSFALLIIGHLNKTQTMNAIYRAGGSTSGWLGKCRAAFLIFRDAKDKDLRHAISLKSNLSKGDPPQLEFRLNEGQMIAQVSSIQVNMDEHLNPQPGRKPREKKIAEEWLDNKFQMRPEIPATELKDAAKECDITATTLKRAKKNSGYMSKRVKTVNGGHGWVWQKPIQSSSLKGYNGENEQPNSRGELNKNTKLLTLLRHIFRTSWTYWSSYLIRMVKRFNKS